MSETHNPTDEFQELSNAARDIARRNLDIQKDVYRITVDALTKGKLEPERIQQVIKAVLEGFQSGIAQDRGTLDETFRKAATGLDEALASAAIATKFAIQEAGSKVGEFADHEMKKSLHQLEKLENQFLDTLHSMATSGTESSREIFTRLAEHTRQSGTAVGSRSAEALTELGNFVEKFGKMSLDTGNELARVTGSSILQIASGFLSGVADSLKKFDPGKKHHK